MKTTFSHARVKGVTAVVPEKCINIDDEIEFFNNDRALLDRNKKILGLGTRHVVDDGVAVSDLLAAAADRLFNGMKCDRTSVDALIVVTSSTGSGLHIRSWRAAPQSIVLCWRVI